MQLSLNGRAIPRRAVYIAAGAVVLAVLGSVYWWWLSQTTISTENAKVAANSVEISSRLTGRIKSIPVKEEEQVTEGQVLIQLENDQYLAELHRAEANLEIAKAGLEKIVEGARPEELAQSAAAVSQAQAGVAKAELALSDQERILKQKETLFASGAISQEEIESARTKYLIAQADLESARSQLRRSQAADDMVVNGALPRDRRIYEAQVKQAEAALQLAQFNYDSTFIKSPVGGTVARIGAQAGETLSPGQAALSVIDLDNVWVQANLEETYLHRLAVGQKARVTIDAYPGVVFNGQVTDIGSAAGSVFSLIPTENTSGNFTKVVQRFIVKIQLEPTGHNLKPGMSAVVKIYTR